MKLSADNATAVTQLAEALSRTGPVGPGDSVAVAADDLGPNFSIVVCLSGCMISMAIARDQCVAFHATSIAYWIMIEARRAMLRKLGISAGGA